MKRKTLALLLCLSLAAGLLSGCGMLKLDLKPKQEVSGVNAESSVAKQSMPDTNGEDQAPSDLQIVESVQRAIDASNHLTSGSYLLLEDGSVMTRDETYKNLAGDIASIPNVKKIADSSSEREMFALTEEGDLYYRQTKIIGGVSDIVYSTTNVNQGAVFVSGDKVFEAYVSDPDTVNATLRSSSPDTYFDVGDRVVHYFTFSPDYVKNLATEEGTPVTGELVRISAEKGDFLILNSAGQVFAQNNGGHSTEYVGLECFNWENIVHIDAAKRMLSDIGDSESRAELTVAGIQADGTVMACGAFADEILSWGPLDYISMDTGAIVGLSTDGTLRVTGPAAEFIEADLAGWKNIVGLKVGDICGTLVVNAVDADGVYHHLEYDHRWLENVVESISPTDGNESQCWYKYCPDGTVYRSRGENGSWIAEN